MTADGAGLAWPGESPLPPVTRIEVAPLDNGWSVRALASCECGPTRHDVTVRAVYAATLEAAVFRFRYVRREAAIAEEAFDDRTR